MSQDYTVNKFISLKREVASVNTNIYINGKLFNQCKYLLISITPEEIEEWDHFDSMDEVIKATSKSRGGGEQHADPITPEEAFWGHCSNLQAWVESGYNYRVLDTRLSIPIVLEIIKGLLKEKDKVKFRKFFMEVVVSLDDYVINSVKNAYTQGRFDFLKGVVCRTRNKYFSDEEITGSIVLKYIYDSYIDEYIRKREIARDRYRKVGKFDRWEAKLWGTGRKNLKHRKFLRRIRNHDEDELTSDEIGYLPYLYSTGKFENCGSISIYYVNDERLIIRDENGKYWKKYRRYG